MAKTGEAQKLFEALSTSQIYSDYRDAFGRATGLPLSLHRGGECKFVQNFKTEQTPQSIV